MFKSSLLAKFRNRRITRRSMQQILTFIGITSLSYDMFGSLESILTKLSKLSNLPPERHSALISRFKRKYTSFISKAYVLSK
ncbi:MAG: hypothetical protein ACTS4T_00355 [Candidatus Hodgkinia cicadicola]